MGHAGLMLRVGVCAWAAMAVVVAGCSGNKSGAAGGTGSGASAASGSKAASGTSAAAVELTPDQGQALLAAIQKDPNKLYHLTPPEKQFMIKAAAAAKLQRDRQRAGR